MSVRTAIEAEIPFLRRYARALTGSQTTGDSAVRATLDGILQAPEIFSTDMIHRVELYRVFHKIWHANPTVECGPGLVAGLSLENRQSLLLSTLEGFGIPEIATILGKSADVVATEIRDAHSSIMASLQANVMIIEDESIIALHIKSIVEDLGHDVVGIARTRTEAVQLAAQEAPELVLADISLADGSSGIDAVKDILALVDTPVIFITAFPERLLTGERPEPTFLITKPFETETVIAIIGQALFLHREKSIA